MDAVVGPAEEPFGSSTPLSAVLARIRAQRNSPLPHQRLPAAVLAALEDSIRDGGEQLSAGSYWVGLVGVLEKLTGAGTPVTDETLAAVVYLLAAVFPSAPQTLVRARFGTTAALLTPLLANAPPPLLRSLITCLVHLLLPLPLSNWISDAACRRVWRMLLLLSADPRPKVRKRAAEGVKLILSRPPTPVTNHPGTAAVLEFLSGGLDNARKEKAGSEERDAATLHLLAFLSSCLPLLLRGASLPPTIAALHALLQKVLRLPSLNPDGITASSVLAVFAALFSTPDDQDHSLDPELLGEFVRTLLEDLKPNERDAQLVPLWLDVVARGLVRLAGAIARTDGAPELYTDAFAARVSTFFSYTFATFFAPQTPVKPGMLNAATSALALVLADALDPLVNPEPHPSLSQIIRTIASSLGQLRFQRTTGQLLRLLSPLFTSLSNSPALSVLLDGSLPTLIGFRDDLDNTPTFDAREELEACLESAVRAAGIRDFLSRAPLNLLREQQGPKSPPRAYLLATFRRALDARISSPTFGPDSLGLLVDSLIPLADTEFGLSVSSTNPVAKKLHATLAGQIWALFPGIARGNPRDTAEAFGKLMQQSWGKILRKQVDFAGLEEAEECLGVVCESLAHLVDGQLGVSALGSEEDGEKAKENLAAIGKQANKILTVLCGLFTELPVLNGKSGNKAPGSDKVERDRTRIQAAIAAFLRIAKGEDVRAYFAQLAGTVARSSLDGQTAEQRYPSLELLGILFPHLPELERSGDKPTLDAYLRLLATEVRDADPGAQKRGYKALASAVSKMDGDRIESVLRGLVDAEIVAAVQPACRKARLGCLANLVRGLPESHNQVILELVPEVLPEAIAGTKEAGEKARNAGFDCLIEMGRRVTKSAGIKEYFAMVTAGLASSETKIQSASVACMSRLLFEFRELMDSQLIGDVVEAALFAAESKNRELAKAGLGFVKVAVVSLPQEQLEDQLERIIQAILVHSREHVSHFKSKTRHIFERLIRRFSFEAVEGFVPEEDRRLLTNIRKRKERAKRRRSGAEADDEDEPRSPMERPGRKTFEEVMADTDSEISDEDVEEREREKEKSGAFGKGKKGSATYIREDADADVLDLLDPRLVSKVVTARPKKRSSRPRDEEFDVDDDGRMVIEDEESEDDKPKKKKPRGGDVEMEDAQGAGAEGGEDYYTEAITGESAFTRGESGKIRFGSGKKKGKSAESFDTEIDAAMGKAGQQQGKKISGKKARLMDDPDVARMLGKQYKAKKAHGDVKRAGMPDPHAYIPLNSKIVGNKRKGVKAASTFKKIVGAAQRGVKKASKVKFGKPGGARGRN